MATGGMLGNGIKVAFSVGSPMTWNKVPQVLEVEFPSETPDKVGKTIHGTVKYKSYMQGLVEVGDMAVTCLADPDELTSPVFETLQQMNRNGTEVWWRIEVPTNRTITRFKPYEFFGYVSEFTLATPIDDKQTLQFSVVYSGTTGISIYAAGTGAIA